MYIGEAIASRWARRGFLLTRMCPISTGPWQEFVLGKALAQASLADALEQRALHPPSTAASSPLPGRRTPPTSRPLTSRSVAGHGTIAPHQRPPARTRQPARRSSTQRQRRERLSHMRQLYGLEDQRGGLESQGVVGRVEEERLSAREATAPSIPSPGPQRRAGEVLSVPRDAAIAEPARLPPIPRASPPGYHGDLPSTVLPAVLPTLHRHSMSRGRTPPSPSVADRGPRTPQRAPARRRSPSPLGHPLPMPLPATRAATRYAPSAALRPRARTPHAALLPPRCSPSGVLERVPTAASQASQASVEEMDAEVWLCCVHQQRGCTPVISPFPPLDR